MKRRAICIILADFNDFVQCMAGAALNGQIRVVCSIGKKYGNTVRMSGLFYFFTVKGNQFFADFYFLSHLDETCKAVACHGYSINTYMNKQFHTVRRCNPYGVFCIGNKGNFSVKGSYDKTFCGVDSNSAAKDTSGKGCIRDFLGRNDCTGNRSINDTGLTLYCERLWLRFSSLAGAVSSSLKPKNQVSAKDTPTEISIIRM